jgi:hypothetical protein
MPVQLRGLAAAELGGGHSGNAVFDAAHEVLHRGAQGSKYDPVWALLKEAALLEVRPCGTPAWYQGAQHASVTAPLHHSLPCLFWVD